VSRSECEHQRYAHEAFITVHALGHAHEGRTNNVSRGGLCAIVESMVPMGTDVEVDIQLVFDDDVRTEPLRVPARVVWCTTVDDAHQIGVSFKALDADKTQLLTVFLRYLNAGPVTKQVKGERSVDDRFR
jgi:hypothetical protein